MGSLTLSKPPSSVVILDSTSLWVRAPPAEYILRPMGFHAAANMLGAAADDRTKGATERAAVGRATRAAAPAVRMTAERNIVDGVCMWFRRVSRLRRAQLGQMRMSDVGLGGGSMGAGGMGKLREVEFE